MFLSRIKIPKSLLKPCFYVCTFFYFTEKGLLYNFNIAKYNKTIITTPKNNVQTYKVNVINTSLDYFKFH